MIFVYGLNFYCLRVSCGDRTITPITNQGVRAITRNNKAINYKMEVEDWYNSNSFKNSLKILNWLKIYHYMGPTIFLHQMLAIVGKAQLLYCTLFEYVTCVVLSSFQS